MDACRVEIATRLGAKGSFAVEIAIIFRKFDVISHRSAFVRA
jgi:hypothetical protein